MRVIESSRDRVVRSAKRRAVAQAYRSYATLLVEHERVRRARWSAGRDAPWEPAPPAWNTLRFLASVHDPKRRGARVLGEFFARHAPRDEGAGAAKKGSRTRTTTRTSTIEARRVPWMAWREALQAGIDLVADVLVAHGAELPWGRGKPRAPRNRVDFESICRFLRDRDVRDDDLASLAEILDSADIAPLPPRRPPPDHRVTLYRGRQVLSIDGVRMALPMGRELAFLELLAERRQHGEVTPRFEHEIDWKYAVEHLRRRIRRATGQDLLRAVVLSARGSAGGYRLAPGVRVRGD